MPSRLCCCLCFGWCASSSSTTTDSEIDGQTPLGPVLVELFSSQGCRASPEAEQLVVGRLGTAADLAGADDEDSVPPAVVLGFHVEYWDYLGWKDPFGSSLWTVRQKAYVEALRLDTLYTPQVVVQGRTQCLGTDEDAVLSAVRSAERFPSPTFQATFQRPSPDTLQVSLAGQLRTSILSTGADVMVALHESGLVTDCTSGENRGRAISNDYVVRRLEKLCSVKDVSGKTKVSGTVSFSLWEGFDGSKCGLVVFVQNSSMQTLGVQQLRLPGVPKM